MPLKKVDTIKSSIGEIKYAGVFDYDGLYKLVTAWFRHHLFRLYETYKHKVSEAGAEIELSWKGERDETEFIRFEITADSHFYELTDVEVVREGKKVKLQRGRFTITIGCTVYLDWGKMYERSAFWVRLFNFLREYVLGRSILIIWLDKVYYEAYRLHTEIKRFLKMEAGSSAYA